MHCTYHSNLKKRRHIKFLQKILYLFNTFLSIYNSRFTESRYIPKICHKEFRGYAT